MSGHLVRALILSALVITNTSCGQQQSSDITQAVERASAMASQNSALASSAPATPMPPTSSTASLPPIVYETSRPSATAGSTIQGSSASGWSEFPWASNDDGKACAPPSWTGDATRQPVVVLGDSTIRDDRQNIRDALAGTPWSPVFVCWGGKTTRWGRNELAQMKDHGLTPKCLVINLGINDVKKDRDAVGPEELQQRVSSLIADTAQIPGVIVVNFGGDPNRSNGLMPHMAPFIQSFDHAVRASGRPLADWASMTERDTTLIGSDGVHDSAAGEIARAQLIARHIATDCSAR